MKRTSISTLELDLNIGELLSKYPELQIEQDDYNIIVAANYGASLNPAQILEEHMRYDGVGRPTHLYFHIPLCSYVCKFCTFVTKKLHPDNAEAELEKWIDALLAESQWYLDRTPWLAGARIESIYIGGGTGSLLTERHLARLLGHVQGNYSLIDDCEITLEGNPDNFMEGEVRVAQRLDVNRFSVGVQSLQSEVNQFAGRDHDREMSLQAIEKLLESGSVFNVDMMVGLPKQTPETVGRDFQTLVNLGVPQITIYRFRNIEKHKMDMGTRSAWTVPRIRDHLHEQSAFPTLEVTYAMREAAMHVLLNYGYEAGPCAYWSLPGTYSEGIPRVSINKWRQYNTMIGFGPGAFSWLTGGSDKVVQAHNTTDMAEYLRCIESPMDMPPLSFGRLLKDHQAIGMALGFGFKANGPIEFDRFQQQFGVDLLGDKPYCQVLEELLGKGFLEYTPDGSGLKPTLQGEALHDEIISVYFLGRIGSFADHC